MNECMLPNKQTYIHTYTHIHNTYIHTYIHTYSTELEKDAGNREKSHENSTVTEITYHPDKMRRRLTNGTNEIEII